jgi:RNA polymerase sigma factor (sigma-70 family)
MDITDSRWRDIIWLWVMRLDYILGTDKIVSLVARQLTEWGVDLAAVEEEIQLTGRMTKLQKRMSWDALRFVLLLHISDLTHERGKKTVRLAFDPAAAEIDSDPAMQLSREEMEELFLTALRKLPRRLRVLVIKKYKGATFRELSEELGMSVGHTHAQFNLAILRLKRVINEVRSKKFRV